jgi:electron transport complex protein RnfA
MINTPLLQLLIYSGFTMNIVLQCGLGIKGIVESKSYLNKSSFIKLGIIFSSIILLWLFLSKFILSITSGIFIYVLLFPVSAVVYDGFEYLIFNHLYKNNKETETFISSPNGITAAAVFICINIANNITEVLILSFGFTSGIFFIFLIIREIRRRAALEAVPVFLRGKPLLLIAMGMLSLIFTAASLLFFRMINAG